MSGDIHLIRDLLDKQILDDEKRPLGMVDGILLEIREGEPPRVVAIESGLPALARRVHPWLEAPARALGRRWGVRRGRACRIPWERVRSHEIEVEVEASARRSPIAAWERWLVRNVVERFSPRRARDGITREARD